jgi:hypothetical protein
MMPLTIAVFLFGLALIVAASVFVTAPLFRGARHTTLDGSGGERERWERQKRQALAAIKEAEFDHRMGKLSDGDLASMRARFEVQALEAMAALEGRIPS